MREGGIRKEGRGGEIERGGEGEGVGERKRGREGRRVGREGWKKGGREGWKMGGSGEGGRERKERSD